MEQVLNTQGLLDRIAHQINCLYLSDLRNPAYMPSIRDAIIRIDASEYPLGEWNDAVQYITTGPTAFSTCDEARNYLLCYEN